MNYSSEDYSSTSMSASRQATQGQASQGKPRRTNAVGRPRTVSDHYLQRLRELVSHDPREFGYPFRRWTARWLNQHLSQELGLSVSDRHINRLLKQMGLSTRTSCASSVFSHHESTAEQPAGNSPYPAGDQHLSRQNHGNP